MRQTIYLVQTILIITLNLSIISCEDDIKNDPKKAILGKWECIEMGNWPDDMRPYDSKGGYTEYLPDGVIGYYDGIKDEYLASAGNYAIDDSLFYLIHTREDGYVLSTKYDYLFYEDKLRLDIRAFAMFNTSIHKRLK